MTEQPDPFIDWDAAYVMGALDPTDRRAFETHLSACPRCTAAVAELAGMPGLLAQVPVEQMLAPRVTPEPPPDTLLPRMAAEVRRQRRQRRVLNAVAGLTAAAVLVIGVLLATGGSGSPAPTGPPSSSVGGTELTMSALVKSPVKATLLLSSVSWGTKVSLSCSYSGWDPPPSGGARRWTYSLVVVPRDGSAVQQVAAWKALADKTITLAGSTDLKPSQIADIQLLNSQGVVILHAAPSV
jgi:hypothetical protein